jgi:hypothetical protein
MEMEEGPFRYHLELTPEQLKITHTALRSLLDDFGHEEAAIQALIHEVLAKLPDEHAIRAIRIGSGSAAAGEVVELSTEPSDGGDPIDPISA